MHTTMPKRNIPRSSYASVFKAQGALRVSEGAITAMDELTMRYIRKITQDAAMYAQHAKRKTILLKDIELALEQQN